jgi:hypothetical protein
MSATERTACAIDCGQSPGCPHPGLAVFGTRACGEFGWQSFVARPSNSRGASRPHAVVVQAVPAWEGLENPVFIAETDGMASGYACAKAIRRPETPRQDLSCFIISGEASAAEASESHWRLRTAAPDIAMALIAFDGGLQRRAARIDAECAMAKADPVDRAQARRFPRPSDRNFRQSRSLERSVRDAGLEQSPGAQGRDRHGPAR